MKKKLNVIIPALLIFMGLSGVEAIQADEFTYTTTTNLNMRSGAGTGNRILLTVPKGQEVIFLGNSGSWYQVSYGGKNGYVSSTYVRKSGKNLAVTNPAPVSGGNARATGTLNMRTGPGTSYAKVGVIPKNTVVNYLGTKDGWHQVSYGGKTGYASGRYMTLLQPEAPVSPEAPVPAVPVPAPTEQTSNSTPTKRYYVTGNLNMRSGPTKSYGVVQVIPAGAEVTYLGEEGWYKVSYNGKVGYASNKFIRIVESEGSPAPPVVNEPVAVTPEPAPSETPSVPPAEAPVQNPAANSPGVGVLSQVQLMYTTSTLNMRTGPGTGYGVVLTLPKGAHMISEGLADGWHKVTYGGKTGYASGKYLSSHSVFMTDGIIMVNKGYGLPASFNPGENPIAKAAFNQMNAEAKRAGISLKLFSGFRNYSYQTTLFNSYVKQDGVKLTETYSARPGYSEHQTGLTFDIGGADSSKWTSSAFGNTSEGKWLAVNAPNFGFILRYPEGKESVTGYVYEPWHFRYVGVDAAKKITASGLTLEEYFGCVHPEYR